jgi:hypothetical protein
MEMSLSSPSVLLFIAALAICTAMWIRTRQGAPHLYVQAALATAVMLWTAIILLIEMAA